MQNRLNTEQSRDYRPITKNMVRAIDYHRKVNLPDGPRTLDDLKNFKVRVNLNFLTK